MSRMATATLVEVMGVTNEGGVAPVGFVDIRPMINQVDGDGNAEPHATIFGCPYVRIQGGTNAVIIDPVIGDIGLAVFSSRDTSSVVASRAQANPGSKRQFDWADAVYVGGLLNGVPAQYLQFSDEGISIVAPVAISVTAPQVMVNGNLVVSTGATGTFTTTSGNIVTVQDGIITNIL